MKYVITGVTVTGNMGGRAMLEAATDALRQRDPAARFTLLSISPDRDREAARDAGVKIVGARPYILAGLYLPLAVLIWPFCRLPGIRNLMCLLPYYRAIAEANAVVDLCGIAFVDRRGLPLLVYNVACCLPAMAVGTPVAKLSQALGPFKTWLNRSLARFVLRRCHAVVARGAVSLAHLKDLEIDGARELPDVTFCLEIPETDQAKAVEIARFGDPAKPLVVASPSEVVRRYCVSGGIDFEKEFSELLRRFLKRGWRILVVPHSFGTGASKNNDIDLSKRIVEDLHSSDAHLVTGIECPRALRAVLGTGDVFIGCRFHAVVGALAMGVPAFVIGWSHKYREMAAMLGQEPWGMDWAGFSADTAEPLFARMIEARDALRRQITEALPRVRQSAAINFDLILEVSTKR